LEVWGQRVRTSESTFTKESRLPNSKLYGCRTVSRRHRIIRTLLSLQEHLEKSKLIMGIRRYQINIRSRRNKLSKVLQAQQIIIKCS
jgi:predicted AAA+ superfamily ATPase